MLAVNLFMITGTWHFLSDALAGSMLGFTAAVLVFWAASALKIRPGIKS
jgi:hypothetical protein